MKLITRKQLLEKWSISSATLWRLEKLKDFPAPIYVGPRLKRYDDQATNEFMDKRRHASESEEAPIQ